MLGSLRSKPGIVCGEAFDNQRRRAGGDGDGSAKRDSMHFDKPLGVRSRFEASHSPLPLPCRLMRVLRSVVK
jgi:hypothetical protein